MSMSARFSYVVETKGVCVGAYRNIHKARKKLLECVKNDEHAFIDKWENGVYIGRFAIEFIQKIGFSKHLK